jgi:hypothetical protein
MAEDEVWERALARYENARREFASALDVISERLKNGQLPTEAEAAREVAAGVAVETARHNLWVLASIRPSKSA